MPRAINPRKSISAKLFIPELIVSGMVIYAFSVSLSLGFVACLCVGWLFLFNSAWLFMIGFVCAMFFPKAALVVFASFFAGDALIGLIIQNRIETSLNHDSERLLYIFDGAIPMILTMDSNRSLFLSHIKHDKSSLWRLSQQLERQVSSYMKKYQINGIRQLSNRRMPNSEIRLDVSDGAGNQKFFRSWTMNYYIIKSNLSKVHA